MQPVLIEVPTGDNAGTYPSLILDFAEGETIVAGVPLERGREVRLEPGAAVNVQIARPDGVHVLRSTVIRRDSRGPSLHLRWPELSERVQRRNHVRVEVVVRTIVSVRVPQPAGEDSPSTDRVITAVTADLSAGGARLDLHEPLEPDAQIRLSLELPDAGAQSSEARVVRGGEHPAIAQGRRFWAAIEFVGMMESVRKEITRFVFDVQRDKLRKGVA
jgi:c-di-GMP-binding flagellar brake protein YcgR